MKRLSSLAITALSMGLLTAAAAPAQQTETASTIDPAAEPPRCVRLVNINGYSVIDDEHLVLNGGASRHYLITLQRRCADLRFGIQLRTTFPRNGRVCRPFLESVIAEDGWRCRAEQIEEVESLEAARALIEARAALDEEGGENSRD